MRRCNGGADSTYLELVLASLRLGLGVKKIDRENLFIDIRQQIFVHIAAISRALVDAIMEVFDSCSFI